MTNLELISMQTTNGVTLYYAKDRIAISSHRLLYIDLQSIADTLTISKEKLLGIIEYDLNIKKSLAHINFNGGEMKRTIAIRYKALPMLIRLVNVTFNDNDMSKTAKAILQLVIDNAEPELGGNLFD